MTRRSIDLLADTNPNWVNVVMDQFDEFLCDHANCERKASALAMSLVVKYPNRTRIIPTLIDVAREELEHFHQVYALMESRGLTLVHDTQDPYVNGLLGVMRHGREERFIDRMLVSSLVECRGAERFGLVAEALTDPELKRFYTELYKCEKKHGHQFVDLALKEAPPDLVYPRLQQLAEHEADIMLSLEWRPSLH
ncbi:MAG: tRNA-(ms[2]io[6]A)-hydroxylase [Xanthomonadales bacterium]|nr:tRNA-(ms[2]io[6]A)-hydroxylase [Xanthomonadales bacterium]